ncbi:MAG: hypothetical protein R3F11_22815 [Verrucomicrobiales bacterium]
MKKVAIVLFVILFVAHHDFWFWDDKSLAFGVIPIGLAYHGFFSLAAATLWLFCSLFAWPKEIEAWADEGDDPAPVPAPASPPQASASKADASAPNDNQPPA